MEMVMEMGMVMEEHQVNVFLVVKAWMMVTTRAVRVVMCMLHVQMKFFMIVVPAQPI